MWVKLQEHLINLDQVVEILKDNLAPYETPDKPFVIKFLYAHGYGYRTVPFQLKEERDHVWQALMELNGILSVLDLRDIDLSIETLNQPTS